VLWNAQWGGGEDLDLLFVTSASVGLSEAQLAHQPHAGDLFVFRSGFRGLPAPGFRQWPAQSGVI
jgi:sugar lactone lactonase YvrE